MRRGPWGLRHLYFQQDVCSMPWLGTENTSGMRAACCRRCRGTLSLRRIKTSWISSSGGMLGVAKAGSGVFIYLFVLLGFVSPLV